MQIRSKHSSLLSFLVLSPRHRENKLLEYVGKAVDVLRQQNGIICATHPNANIYTMLSSLVEFDGFYLESDPCLVCNNPEVPFAVSLARKRCCNLGACMCE